MEKHTDEKKEPIVEVIKQERNLYERLKNELIPKGLLFVIIVSFLIWVFYKENSENLVLYLCISILLFSLLYNSFKSARNQIYKIRLWKDKFELWYFDKNERFKLESEARDQIEVKLESQGWGIFPMKDDERVVSLTIRIVNKDLKICQPITKEWTSKNLFNLYFDGFKKNEHYYRLKNNNTVFEN